MFQEQLHYTVALYMSLFLTCSHTTLRSVKLFAEYVSFMLAYFSKL